MGKTIEEKLEAELGIVPSPPPRVTVRTKPEVEVRSYDDSVLSAEDEAKFDIAESELATAKGLTEDAIHSLLELAKNTEEPRAYEVVEKLMRLHTEQISMGPDIIMKKEKLKKMRREAKKADNVPMEGTPSKVTNNAIFVGSTAEILKIVKGQTGA